MDYLVSYHDYLFRELGDGRVKTWLFMSNPHSMLLVLMLYLAGIRMGKMLMENRKPFEVKRIMFYYNIVQIIANTVLALEYLSLGWMRDYSMSCQMPDYSNGPGGKGMLNIIYWTFCLKVFSLVETFFCILRKRDDQISALHVYYKVVGVAGSWIICKFVGGGLPTFGLLLNCGSHVLIHVYYFLSSLGPDWHERMNEEKPGLVRLQMGQIVMVLFQSNLGLEKGCSFPSILIHISNVCIVLLLYMFGSFYMQFHQDEWEQNYQSFDEYWRLIKEHPVYSFLARLVGGAKIYR